MSVKRITPLPAFSGVAAGVTATADIPVGPRYHVAWLTIANSGDEAFTDILGDIRIKVNGKVQRTMSAAQLDAINKLQGAEYGAQLIGAAEDPGHVTRLPIYLAEPWRKQVQAGDGLAWATGNLSTLQIEMDLLTNTNAPTLSGFVEVDNSIVTGPNNTSQQAPLGIISKWFRTNIPINGTTQDILSFPRRDHYQQLSFFDANITAVEISVENFMIRKISKGG